MGRYASLSGPAKRIKERYEPWADSGATTLVLRKPTEQAMEDGRNSSAELTEEEALQCPKSNICTGRLGDEPETGHNRWHPDIEPKLMSTRRHRDLGDPRRSRRPDQRGMTVDDLATLDKAVGHPLTGPIWVNGAKPGTY